MSQATLDQRSGFDTARTVGREIVGVLAGGFLAAATWMIVANEGFSRGWSEQNFPEALGEIRGAELTDIPRLGLWTGLVAGTALCAVVLPLAFRVVPGPWYARGLPLAVVAFLLWGLWFSPAIDAESSFPGGVFGSEAGRGTLITFGLAALAYAAIGARVYSVATSLDFWNPKHNDLREQGAQMIEGLGLDDELPLDQGGEASLELPEERGSEGGKAAKP
ncbi:MAG: hypothetical protein OEM67_09650 [Thermoleophilia bacterium]|nr:hypothetical protein [Thermoleophilia bacterium]MDH3725312.1 hypothetical protein [Thermoleophilia bacterium]